MSLLRLPSILLATVLAGFLGCNSTEEPGWNSLASTAASSSTAAPATQPLELDRPMRRDARDLRQAVTYLASDDLEGRGLATEGIEKAADYIARSFKSSGARPLPGLDGYFQPFEITLSTDIGSNTSLSIAGQELELRTEFVPLGLSAETEFAGPLAFVGYAIASEQHKYDDFAGMDLKGKVALALRYEPVDAAGEKRFSAGSSDFPSTQPHAAVVTGPTTRPDLASLSAKAKAAADRGAVALIIVNPPDSNDSSDELSSLRRSGGSKAPIPVLQMTRAAADRALRGAGARDVATLRAEIDREARSQSFSLSGVTASGGVALDRHRRTTRNVVAYVPGKGPMKHEYIVVGAHYDHLGRGESGSLSRLNANEIHNGADDNASGTAVLMQLAKHVARDPLPRSVVFVAFTGEERGLLGSALFLDEPPVPLDRIVAMLNLDMVGRLQNNTLEVGGTGTASEFDAIVQRVDAQIPLRLKSASQEVGGKSGMGPSDHASFAAKRIPVMFLWTGTHIDYHRPTDDSEKINYAGMAHVVDATRRLVAELSTMPRTQYVDKFDRSGRSVGSMRVRLGIMPDYSDEDPGVRVGSAFPDSPAARAGIKDGDVIVRIGDAEVASLEQYMEVLSKHKPGDTVRIGVLRNGQPMEMEATFTRPRG